MQQSGNSDSGQTVIKISMCHCGRAPNRSGQRNCHFCNAEAAKKYRLSVKKLIELARSVKQLMGGDA